MAAKRGGRGENQIGGHYGLKEGMACSGYDRGFRIGGSGNQQAVYLKSLLSLVINGSLGNAVVM